MPNSYRIDALARDEKPLLLDWAAAQGWNPGLHDGPCFHAADPQGFLVGRVDEEPVATISVVKYGAGFGFLGFYLDTPHTNAEALALVRRHGMSAVFETARMYTGPAPSLPMARLYGVTSFELG